MPVWIRKFSMSGTVSLPVFENECHTLLSEWCSRNGTNPWHGLAVAPLRAGKNFPAALGPHLFQLQERWGLEGHPGWSWWCLSPTNCLKNHSFCSNSCSKMEIWEWESAGRWSLVMSCSSQHRAQLRALGEGWGSPPSALGSAWVLWAGGGGAAAFTAPMGQEMLFSLWLSKPPSFLGSQQSHPPWGCQLGLSGVFGLFYLDSYFFFFFYFF